MDEKLIKKNQFIKQKEDICTLGKRPLVNALTYTNGSFAVLRSYTLIVRPFGRAFLSWVTERRGRETDRRPFHTESHLT